MEKLNRPTVIHLYPTMTCQLKCSYCYVDAVNKETEELSIKDYKKIIDEALDLEIDTFDIAGGEPFLYKNIIELLSVIKGKGAKSKLVSNGFYIDKYIHVLKENKGIISELHVSLDSPNEKIHDSIRGLNGLHKKVTENVSMYIKEGLGPVKINYVLQKETFKKINDMLNFVLNLGANGIDIQYVEDVSDKTRKGSFSLDVNELIETLQEIIRWKSQNINNEFEIVLALPSYIYPVLTRDIKMGMKEFSIKTIYFPGLLKNNSFQEAIIIKHNGDVTGYTSYINSKEWICGNVCEKTLKEILEHDFPYMREKMKERSKKLMDDECKECPSKRYCRGGDPIVFKKIEQGMACDIKKDLKNYLT